MLTYYCKDRATSKKNNTTFLKFKYYLNPGALRATHSSWYMLPGDVSHVLQYSYAVQLTPTAGACATMRNMDPRINADAPSSRATRFMVSNKPLYLSCGVGLLTAKCVVLTFSKAPAVAPTDVESPRVLVPALFFIDWLLPRAEKFMD